MRRPLTYLILLGLIISTPVYSQSLSLADLQGSWFFHRYYVDSALFADADKPTPFPAKEFEMFKQEAAAMPGVQVPDSMTFAASFRQNHENYRRYQLVFNADSTYTTELAAGMSKWLPVNGRLTYAHSDGAFQMIDGSGVATTTAMKIKDGELHLSLADPTFFGDDSPKLNRELVFRRQQP